MIKCYRDNRCSLKKDGKDVFMRARILTSGWGLMLHAWIRVQKPLDAVGQLAAIAPVAPYGESTGNYWDKAPNP